MHSHDYESEANAEDDCNDILIAGVEEEEKEVCVLTNFHSVREEKEESFGDNSLDVDGTIEINANECVKNCKKM